VLNTGGALAQGPNPRAPRAAMGTAFTYQGQLKSSGSPYNCSCDFEFRLYDDASTGTQIGTTQTKTATLSSGLFTIPDLDFGAGAFTGDARWLDISVRCPSGSGSYTALTPRQQLTPAPYALYASSAGTATTATTVTTATNNWNLSGNSGTTAGSNFLGTADNAALEFKVDNTRAYRIEPHATSPNLIGGYSGNSVTSGVYGATIGGGGSSMETNRVTDHFGTIGGGLGNTASGMHTTISGGTSNVASGHRAAIGGGQNNTAGYFYTTIGGGFNNTASGYFATIPGGSSASATHYGEMAYASGAFTVAGEAQTSTYVLRRASSGTTLTELFLDGTSQRLTIADGRTVAFEILVVGRSSTGESAGYQFRGVIERVGSTTAIIGTVSTVTPAEDDATWSVTVDADDTNDALRIQVQGGSGDTVRWVAMVRTVEVQY